MQYKVLFKRCLLAIVVMFVVTSLQAQREMKMYILIMEAFI